jgi:hypothetical protein
MRCTERAMLTSMVLTATVVALLYLVPQPLRDLVGSLVASGGWQ